MSFLVNPYIYAAAPYVNTDFLSDSSLWLMQDSSEIGVSSNKLNYDSTNNGSNDAASYDIGIELSDTWLMRYKNTITALVDGSPYTSRFSIMMGALPSSSSSSVSQDAAGNFIQWFNTSAHKKFMVSYADNGRPDSNPTASAYIPAVETKYIEVIRDGTDLTLNIFNDVGYTSLNATISTTISGTVSGLRYLRASNRVHTGSGSIEGYIENLALYDTVTSPP